MFPEGDDQFQEAAVKSVSFNKNDGGYGIEREDGFWFSVPADSPVEPVVGMTARFYGKGIGYTVRGLFLDGQKVFYRTEAEDKERHETDMYGVNAAEWLKRWDDGRTVFTIEMGGMGPGYEQCIHITCAEMVRHMLSKQYDAADWSNVESWKRDRDELERVMFDTQAVTKLGLSGAQHDAALQLATRLYRDGPRAVMTHPDVLDRHIQVSRNFP